MKNKIFKFLFASLTATALLSSCSLFSQKSDEPGIEISEHELILEPSNSHEFTFANAGDNISLKSSDENIVQVLSNNKIKGLKEGRATITVKNLSNNTEDTCKVAVRYNQVESLYSLGVATIAHKGYHVEAIENTYDAFVEAGRRNFYGIETDIHITFDGHWICNHDNKVKGMSKNISECTLEEILEVNLSENPEKKVQVCQFEDYINVCSAYNKHPIIEIKEATNRDKLENVIDILVKANVLDNVVFISKLGEPLGTLYNIKVQQSYKYDLQMLTESFGWQYVSEFINVSSQYEAIDSDMINSCKSIGQYVAAWTVNDIETATSLINLGVKYITTDLYECAEQFVDKNLFGI